MFGRSSRRKVCTLCHPIGASSMILWCIKGSSAKPCGLVETALGLFLLLLLTWGCAVLMLILIQKTRTTQAAWVYGMALSHNTSTQKAETLSRATTGLTQTNFDDNNSLDCSSSFSPSPAIFDNLPMSFRGFLLAKTATEHTVSVRSSCRMPLTRL